MRNEKAEQYCKEFQQLVTDRCNFESQWDEVAELVLPSQRNTFNPFSERMQGTKQTEMMFDSTAPDALDKFVSVLEYLITPSGKQWAQLGPEDEELREDRETLQYFETVTDLVFKVIYNRNAGFSVANQGTIESMGAYGNGVLWVDPLKGMDEVGVRFRSLPIGESYIRENHQRIPDSLFRHFWWTARQMAQEFGYEKLPEKAKSALDANKLDHKFRILHVTRPRSDFDPERSDYKAMPYTSCYFSYDDKFELGEEGGFRVFPAAIGRYKVRSGDLYGYGPNMDTLPSIKMLNQMAKIHIKQGHRAVDPPLLAHGEEGAMGAFALRPGAINYGFMSAEGRALVQPLTQGNLVENEKMMAWQANIINSANLVTVFQIFQENPQMTATEVLEKAAEKGIFLAPKAMALQASYGGAIVTRVVDILWQLGALPPMPRQLVERGGKYTAFYESPIVQMQQMSRAAAAERQLQIALGLVGAVPDALDIYDIDDIQRDIGRIRGMSVNHFKSQDDVEAARAARAEAAQQQQMMTAAPGAAALMKAGAVASNEPKQ